MNLSLLKKIIAINFIAIFLILTNITVVLADEPTTPPATTTPPPATTTTPPAATTTPPETTACDDKPLVQPFIIWDSSSNQERKAYCDNVICLNTRLENLRNSSSNSTSNQNQPQRISDDKCQTLLCKNSTDTYYKSYNQLRGDLNENCTIENGQEKCIAEDLPNTQNLCTQCKSALEAANRTPLDVAFSSQLVVNNEIKNISNREELNNLCGKFRNVNSCTIGLSCNNNGEIITSYGTQLTESADYSRIPFGTEFFDVTDTTKGIKLEDQGNSNFNINIEGGPIVGTINTVANFLVRMISVFALVIFIVGAFLLITANGDENRLNQGKDAIKYSLLGIVIVMFSYLIVILVQSIFF